MILGFSPKGSETPMINAQTAPCRKHTAVTIIFFPYVQVAVSGLCLVTQQYGNP